MTRILSVLLGCLLTLGSVQSFAVPIVYTDRMAWEAALGALTTEDFNSFADGAAVGPGTVFPSGISLSTNSDIRDFGFGDIGEGTALNGTNQTIILPGSPIAFGFDYVDVDLTGVTISFGSFAGNLPSTGDADAGVTPDDFGFYGVVLGSTAEMPGAMFSFSGEGFTLDNLSFTTTLRTVPEPGTFFLVGLGLVGFGRHLRSRRHVR